LIIIKHYFLIGAVKSSEWMYLGADKLKKSIVPQGIPTPVDPRLQTSLEAAQWVTSKTVKASGYLVSKAGTATVALGRFLAPHIKKQSTKALRYMQNSVTVI
jgi:spartin